MRDLQVRYGGRLVADVPELDVGAGECVAIVGESGSGKSTTLLSLLGLTENAEISGQVRVCGVDVLTASQKALREIRGARAALVMQSPQAALSPATRLGTLMRRALKLHGRQATDEAMARALEEVVLDREILRRYPHEISGGQAQRFAIALAIALGAEVVLADEPTSALGRDRAGRGGRRAAAAAGRAGPGAPAGLPRPGPRLDDRRPGARHEGRRGSWESGPAAEVLAEPSHPYTRELLEGAAVTTLRAERVTLGYGRRPVVHEVSLGHHRGRRGPDRGERLGQDDAGARVPGPPEPHVRKYLVRRPGSQEGGPEGVQEGRAARLPGRGPRPPHARRPLDRRGAPALRPRPRRRADGNRSASIPSWPAAARTSSRVASASAW
ncbi:hypothetical protein GCM10020220_034950 [Nonomuraea rubra]